MFVIGWLIELREALKTSDRLITDTRIAADNAGNSEASVKFSFTTTDYQQAPKEHEHTPIVSALTATTLPDAEKEAVQQLHDVLEAAAGCHSPSRRRPDPYHPDRSLVLRPGARSGLRPAVWREATHPI